MGHVLSLESWPGRRFGEVPPGDAGLPDEEPANE
jgi:hypothetical protein